MTFFTIFPFLGCTQVIDRAAIVIAALASACIANRKAAHSQLREKNDLWAIETPLGDAAFRRPMLYGIA
jgi:hypothetical protein